MCLLSPTIPAKYQKDLQMPDPIHIHAVCKPTVHLECLLKENSTCRFDLIREDVRQWMVDNYSVIVLDSDVLGFDIHETLCGFIENIRVVEVSGSLEEVLQLDQVELEIHIYKFSKIVNHSEYLEDEDDTPAANIINLPSEILEGIWETLIFEDDLKKSLLLFIHAIMLFSDHGVDQNIIALNRLIILHGPPGTGKTSLCKSLSQKLSIRMSKRYPRSQLIEINVHSLFSKYFSESGKLVGKIFGDILKIVEDGDSFVCVLIDEVESLVSARKAAVSGCEPSDALRVVNALLTQLDRLKSKPNVLVMATSNLLEAMDEAFIDRAGIVSFVGNPALAAIYSILRSCLNELARARVIESQEQIITYAEAIMKLYSCPASDSSKLYRISEICKGMSGRLLRGLPVIAFSRYIQKPGLSLADMISALYQVAKEEQKRLEQR
ncbi:Pachytene checkpoint protein 2 [Neolecta irregularis DAH-3]|uniref:Pachytene checkpoint protein 2 n=1 Tax=Neolecta irregularis (strain DAH-3) TaxID=1198029 RepID=A0A1U7LM40_NEOID|nr:Pachytene checkpoint protein 2 [Neolecta irregularis DAH-3]|eukprot:OLL23724.1 Pachytene checkpoint protein 2 [Neolecta irregularis DAH-3]